MTPFDPEDQGQFQSAAGLRQGVDNLEQSDSPKMYEALNIGNIRSAILFNNEYSTRSNPSGSDRLSIAMQMRARIRIMKENLHRSSSEVFTFGYLPAACSSLPQGKSN